MGYAEHRNIEERPVEWMRDADEKVLGDAEVLELLKADASANEDRLRIVGIGNGLVIGTVLWALIATLVLVAWY